MHERADLREANLNGATLADAKLGGLGVTSEVVTRSLSARCKRGSKKPPLRFASRSSPSRGILLRSFATLLLTGCFARSANPLPSHDDRGGNYQGKVVRRRD